MSTPSIDDLRRYRSDPMVYFADSIIPAAGGNARLGDVWAPFQVEAFKVLADAVLAVAAGEKPRYRGVMLVRTKGSSKDYDLALALVWLLVFSERPQLIECAADDFDQIAELRKAMGDDVRLNSWKGTHFYQAGGQRRSWGITIQKTRAVNETTGSECCFLTRDALGSHGSRPTVSVLNELSHISVEDTALTVFDNADKSPNNLMLIATNSGHIDSWQHKWMLRYSDDSAWFHQAVTAPAPWIAERNLRDAERRNPPSRFRRLWRGEWTTPGGDHLPYEWITRAICDYPTWPDRDEWPAAALGIDLGVFGDHSSIVVLRARADPPMVRSFECLDYPPPVNLDTFRDEVIRIARFHGVKVVRSDPWQAIGMIQTLLGLGFDAKIVHPTPKVENAAANALQEALRNRQLEVNEDHELLIEDLKGAKITERLTGDDLRARKVALRRNENGHSDRLAAMLTVLGGSGTEDDPGILAILPHLAEEMAMRRYYEQQQQAQTPGFGGWGHDGINEPWGGG